MIHTDRDWDLFDINPNKLDQQWQEQPRLYHQYAVKLADAQAEYERAEARLDVVEAELDRDIRQDPVSFGLAGKVTEKQVEHYTRLDKKWWNAKMEVITTKHTAKILEAVVKGLDHRKASLENHVRLEARDYFSRCEPPKGQAGERFQLKETDRVFGSNKRPE